jgi:hypothetical protein
LDRGNLIRLERFNKMKAMRVALAFFDRPVDGFSRSFDIAKQQVQLRLRAKDVTSSLFFLTGVRFARHVGHGASHSRHQG